MKTLCIEHKQKGNKWGYAKTNRKINGKLKGVLLHRAIYCDHNNDTFDSIAGLEVRHKCDNPRCINPLHLEIGTHADNMNDMKVRGRAPRGSRSGNAKMTWDSVRELRKLYATGNYTQMQLAVRFNISSSQVGYIVGGKQWVE